MGIFKETLSKYVEKQLNLRQSIIRKSTDRSSNGLFHAYTTNKYCNIRMASGVDITNDELLELDIKIGNVQLEKDLRGFGLAKNYILQGGTLLNPKGAKTPAMRRGFPGKGRPLGGAYGDPLMRGNAKDGYGIVPMPGITKINVRTKSAYGSLREAKVDFVCHNLRQLAVLEILYMRPGYPVLLEWCWDPYITPDGKISKPADVSKHYISNNNDFFKGLINQTYVCAEIARQRKRSGGNYDGILGLVKNFSYSARPDGGFNCTTELMALGESITTIKGRDFEIKDVQVPITNTNNDTAIMLKDIRLPHILDFLEKTHDYIYQQGTTKSNDTRTTTTEGGDDKLGTEDDDIVVGKNFNRSAAYHDTPDRKGEKWITFYKDRINVYNIPYEDVKKQYEQQYYGIDPNTGDPVGVDSEGKPVGLAFKDYHTMHFTKGRSKWKEAAASALLANPTILFNPGTSALGILAYIWLSTSAAAARAITEGYVRLDALCYIINYYCMNSLPKNAEERRNVFQTMKYNPAKAGTKQSFRMNTFKRYEADLSAVIANQSGMDDKWKPSIVDLSTDPYVCLMPGQITDQHTLYNFSEKYCQPIRNGFGYPSGPSPYDFDSMFDKSFPLGAEGTLIESQQSIGHIMVNLRYLLKCHDEIFEKGKENKDYSLGKFMEKVLSGINDVMGNGLKLSMTSDNEFPNVTQIVDLNHGPKDEYEDIFEFNVLSDSSIVRQFSFNSAVPSAMASTIAVGAGDPDNASDLDAITFAAMNRGIRNRLYQPDNHGKTSGLTDAEKTELKTKYESEMIEIIQIGNSIADYQLQIQSGTILDNTEQNKKEIALAKSNLARLQSLINIVSTKDEEGQQKPRTNPPASTPIPIKIDMVLDGIGGLVIGQLFRVNESRLPLAYRNKNVIFVVVTEEQDIDADGKWVTKISGQMQLFPDEVAQKPPTQTSIDLANFDAVPHAERLRVALHSFNDDEATIESIFFDEGFSRLELQKIEYEFNTGTSQTTGKSYKDAPGRSIMKLHEWLEDDYRYSGKSNRAGKPTGNELAAKMYELLGHTPTW